MTLDHTKIGHFPTNPYLQNKLIQNLSKKKTYPNFFFNKNNDNRPKKKEKKKKSLITRPYDEASMGHLLTNPYL